MMPMGKQNEKRFATLKDLLPNINPPKIMYFMNVGTKEIELKCGADVFFFAKKFTHIKSA